jgi:hypothetical protein
MTMQWIPVSERLPVARYGPVGEKPITSDDVLVIYESGDIGIASYDADGSWYDNILDADPQCNPTHWMPLPEPPK